MVRETIPVASKNSVLVALLHESNNYWNVLNVEDNDIKIELNIQAHNMHKDN